MKNTSKLLNKEFFQKNERRLELAHKKVYDVLSSEEESEFQILQDEILKITSELFPPPDQAKIEKSRQEVESGNCQTVREILREIRKKDSKP